MKILVLGAGVVGTASAWYLARAGHAVTVIDRQGAAGLETSLANGGQISASHAEPWANPSAPGKILQWLGREDAPLLFRMRADARQWAWGLRFLAECLPWRTRANTREILSIALYSRAELQHLRSETGIRYDQQTRGILHFHTNRKDFDRAVRHAEMLRQYGCEGEIKTPDECVAMEPALAHARSHLVGATFRPSDESGDAHKFTQALAALAEGHGVRFRYGCSVERIETEHGRVASVIVHDVHDGAEESVTADAYVVALGSYSPLLLARAGISIPVYPVKGYSITIPLEEGDEAPHVSLTDEEAKLVFTRLGERLRVAGTAELAGYDTELRPERCEALLRRTFELFPRAGRPERAEHWTGLRPATPSNVPLIGRMHLPNLYLNTGHGTLGWTLACGSGKALADIVDGKRPEPKFGFLGVPERRRSPVLETAPRSGY
ncbi:MAG: D-amino acid dehydrogenase [Betaproteobacteria bacterium]|jgi:D-amino-acid dehydrogenase|nr:D-amino acid dehydrogenase [Betaproteobacteria bacterium]